MNTRALLAIPMAIRDITQPPLATSWSVYQLRRRLFWACLLVGPVIALVTAATLLVEPWGVHGLVWPLVAWATVTLVAAMRWQACRCPRCEERFFARNPPVLALRTSHCVHCMLPKD